MNRRSGALSDMGMAAINRGDLGWMGSQYSLTKMGGGYMVYKK